MPCPDWLNLHRTRGIVVGQGLTVLGLEPGGEAGELGEDAGTLYGLAFAVMVVPGQAPDLVVADPGRRIGQFFASDGVVLVAVQEMDEAPLRLGLVPNVIAVLVLGGGLFDESPGR